MSSRDNQSKLGLLEAGYATDRQTQLRLALLIGLDTYPKWARRNDAKTDSLP